MQTKEHLLQSPELRAIQEPELLALAETASGPMCRRKAQSAHTCTGQEQGFHLKVLSVSEWLMGTTRTLITEA